MIIYRTKKTEELHNKKQKRNTYIIFALIFTILIALVATFATLYAKKSFQKPTPDTSWHSRYEANLKDNLWDGLLSQQYTPATPKSNSEFYIISSIKNSAQAIMDLSPRSRSADPNDYKLFSPSTNACLKSVISYDKLTYPKVDNPKHPDDYVTTLNSEFILTFNSTSTKDPTLPGTASFDFLINIASANLLQGFYIPSAAKPNSFSSTILSIKKLNPANEPEPNYPKTPNQ